MDEGKPTRAKWWSLPRPQSSPARQDREDRADDIRAESSPAPGDADGDFALARPNPVPNAADAPTEQPGPAPRPEATTAATSPFPSPSPPAPGALDDGDYELSRPATSARAAGAPHAGALDDSVSPRHLPEHDAERPAASSDSRGVGAEQGAAIPGPDPVGPADGDDAGPSGALTAAGSLDAGSPDAEVAPSGPVVADALPAGAPGPQAPPGIRDPRDVADAGAGTSTGTSAGASTGTGTGERRSRPLHDPDPYSTPPYGEPGPWAPAPPVQHPAIASAPASAPVSVPAPRTAAPAPAPDAPSHPAPPPAEPEAQPVPLPSGLPAPAPSAPADPWRRYDPWSANPFGGSVGAESVSGAQRRRRVRTRLVGGAVAVALVAGGLGGAVGAWLERNGGLRPIRLPQASAEPGRAVDGVAGIAARALPGVVTLHVGGGDSAGTGTGFVLDSLGYILTNNHVVESAKGGGGISVVFEGGQTVEAEVVGRDSGYDLAVVRVTGVKGLKPLHLGNSDDVRVGDPVVAIGAPFDLEGTVTSGIISARERPVVSGGGSGDASDVSYVDALQTDAPINPGNSGGPLLDARGRVIGVNSAIRSGADGADDDAQGGSIGLGFAIPINQGRRVAEELINTGRATHPVIGVSLDMDYAGDGARVSATGADGNAPVTPGGPGDRAGIRSGDVITEVDGRRVHTGGELIVRTRAHRPGDRLELTVERAGRERTLTLVLGSSGDG